MNPGLIVTDRMSDLLRRTATDDTEGVDGDETAGDGDETSGDEATDDEVMTV